MQEMSNVSCVCIQDMRIDFQFDKAAFNFKFLPFKIPYPVPFKYLGDETKVCSLDIASRNCKLGKILAPILSHAKATDGQIFSLQGWIDITYLSSEGDFRLSRGNKGTLFILTRDFSAKDRLLTAVQNKADDSEVSTQNNLETAASPLLFLHTCSPALCRHTVCIHI